MYTFYFSESYLPPPPSTGLLRRPPPPENPPPPPEAEEYEELIAVLIDLEKLEEKSVFIINPIYTPLLKFSVFSIDGYAIFSCFNTLSAIPNAVAYTRYSSQSTISGSSFLST